jgi:hypothetical protein
MPLQLKIELISCFLVTQLATKWHEKGAYGLFRPSRESDASPDTLKTTFLPFYFFTL